MKIDEFRDYLQIDKLNLDEDVIHQPALFYEVSEACAEAIAFRDAMAEDLAIIDAKLDREARQKLSDPKEAEVKAFIKTAKKHEAAFDAYLQAKEEAEKFTALKDAFKTRGQALKIMADLYASNYFEDAALKTSANEDRVVYQQQRARLAAKRKPLK